MKNNNARSSIFLLIVVVGMMSSQRRLHSQETQESPDPSKTSFADITEADAVFEGERRITFETNPVGHPIELGKNIAKEFVDWGVLFETSKEESFIGVVQYDIRQASTRGARCAANVEPLYQADVTIRFCKPGDESMPATVQAVGCWVGHVYPEQTTMEAYNAEGEVIGKVKTELEGCDFLGIKSALPIAFVRIRGSKMDPDFAIDDVTFVAPQVTVQSR